MGFRLESDAFGSGTAIPRQYTGEGRDVSPALRWFEPPSNTRSYVLVVVDPDAPRGTFTHWVVFDIPNSVTSLDEGWTPDHPVGVSGTNDFGNQGYDGPMPPPGHGRHRYYFRLFATDLDQLRVGEGARRDQVERALEGHVLGTAEIMGSYERPAQVARHA